MEMKIPVHLVLIILGWLIQLRQSSLSGDKVLIGEGMYENRDHYIISTPSATYYYDKAGGGFSRMIDPSGADWINFKMQPWDQYPESAASSYRGIPNLVYGSEESGAGHPGHNQCTTTKINDQTLLTRSKSGKWEWVWEFSDDHAKLRIIKIDPDQPYWFLYEGIPGGIYHPNAHYFGHNHGGPHHETPDYYRGDKIFDKWQWFYAGTSNYDHVLFLCQLQPDDLSDTFSYLGNSGDGINAEDGMIVFGFGRAEGAKPLLRSPHTFIIGFYDKPIANRKNQKRIGRYIRQFQKNAN